ncbi:Fc.00g075350.m01.CDS01 [Cosmosporella sp. VM-42]
MLSQSIHQVADELGLVNLYRSCANIKLLCIQRFIRMAAYGATTLVLVEYLQFLNISKTQIGVFMALTLGGDVCLSFFLTMFADRIGRKAVLALGAGLMVGSGVVFALSRNFWILLAAAVFGVISPSGNEIGPFRAIEESIVAQLTLSASRSDIYAWYSLVGAAGTAFGAMGCGWTVHFLTENFGWNLPDAYRGIFYGYSALGALKLMLVLSLSHAVEAEGKHKPPTETGETAPLLAQTPALEQTEAKPKSWNILPDIDKKSLPVIIPLCFLFSLDAFASGIATMSWITFFFRWKYDIENGKLGSIFFTTSIIAAISTLAASSIAKRCGNINTMVFGHLPSAIFLSLIPIWDNAQISLIFLILRACTQSMDVAPRSAFLATIILPRERTAVMGLINVLKTVAQGLGSLITGNLVDRNVFWVAFVVAGSLKATYDLGVLALFKDHERERAEQERLEEERRGQDEESSAG